MPPFQAALRGSREVGFTIISISSSLIAVFIPIFFMPGVIGLLFHEFAVDRLARHRGVGVRLADAGADARQPLPEGRGAQEAAGRARARCSSAPSMRRSRGYTRSARRRACAIASVRRLRRVLTFVATAWLFVDHPEGLLPRGRHRPDQRHAPKPPRTPRSRRWCGCRTGSSTIMRADPNVATVNSFNGGGGVAEHRAPLHQPQAARRAPADEAGGRGPAPEAPRGARHQRSSCGRSRTCSSAAARARRSYQYILQSVQADELNDWALRLQEPMRADPLFRDVTSDSQLKGLQASLQDRPRPRQHARRVDR